MFALQCRRSIAANTPLQFRRAISTLPNNPHIVRDQHTEPTCASADREQYIHSNSPSSHTLSYLPTSPPNGKLAIGSTTALPPTPESLTENHNFLSILQSVIREHATKDPEVQAAAAAYASSAGSSLGSGGVFFPANHPSRQHVKQKRRSWSSGGGVSGGGGGPTSRQGGIGGAARGGWVHVSDRRNPPDYGRIAWPEDIFGSLEVDGEGSFVGNNGNYQESGTYRVVTREGM